MSTRRAAQLQVALEGIALPAAKNEIVAYARLQGEQAHELEALPDHEHRSLDEVGEALAPVQPHQQESDTPVPRPKSGDPPGGSRGYVEPASGKER